MNNKLQESFYSSPFEEKTAVKVDGETVGYISPQLIEETLNGINRNGMFSPETKKKLQRAINTKGVIPVYLYDLWALDITQQFFSVFTGYSTTEQNIMGFYNGRNIYIMASNIRSLAGEISNKQMYDIMAHEHQHKFAGEKPGYSKDPKVREILDKWFDFFIDDYYGKDMEKDFRNKLKKYFTFIQWESNKGILNGAKWSNRYNTLFSMAGNEKDLSEETLEKHKNLLRYLETAFDGDIDYENMGPYFSGRRAYKSIGIDPNTYIYQEFMIPSEVICVCAGNNTKIGNYFLSKYL